MPPFFVQTDKPVWPILAGLILFVLLSLLNEWIAGAIAFVIGWVVWLAWLLDVFGTKEEK